MQDILDRLSEIGRGGYDSGIEDIQEEKELEFELHELCMSMGFTEAKSEGRYFIREQGRFKANIAFPRIMRQMGSIPKSREIAKPIPPEVDEHLDHAKQIISQEWEQVSDEYYYILGQIRTGQMAKSNSNYLRRWYSIQRLRVHMGKAWRKYQQTYAWTGKGDASYSGAPPAEVTLDKIDSELWYRNWLPRYNQQLKLEARQRKRDDERQMQEFI